MARECTLNTTMFWTALKILERLLSWLFLSYVTDEFARKLLYSEVPSYYTWKKKFCRRKQRQIISGHTGIRKYNILGSVYTVHPGNAECYYLRLLLHEIRGPHSFISLKTVAGRVYPTFQNSCRALGLLQDDAHWDRTLEEAVLTEAPSKIYEVMFIYDIVSYKNNCPSLLNKICFNCPLRNLRSQILFYCKFKKSNFSLNEPLSRFLRQANSLCSVLEFNMSLSRDSFKMKLLLSLLTRSSL